MSEPMTPEELQACRKRAEAATQTILTQLPEYSASLPTGTTVGKRWRRDVNAYRNPCRVEVLGLVFVVPWPPEWWIGEYVEADEPGMVGVQWTKVEQ